MVLAEGKDLHLLSLPTLLQLADGSWGVLHGRSGQTWDLEDRSGRRLAPLAPLELSGLALERLPYFAPGDSLRKKLFRMLMAH